MAKSNKKLKHINGSPTIFQTFKPLHVLLIPFLLSLSGYVIIHFTRQTPLSSNLDNYSIPSIKWNSIEDVIRGKVPLMISDSPSVLWKANTMWTNNYLKSKIRTFHKVHQSENPRFVHYDENLELSSYYPKEYETKDMDSQSFFQALSSDVSSRLSNHSQYLYFNNVLSSVSRSLTRDVEPSNGFVVNHPPVNVVTDTSHDYSEKMMKIWIGTKGVIANLHYDAVHNFFHQIRGSKKFTLLPPSAWEHLAIYSRLHPHHRQSQFNLSSLPQHVLKEKIVVVLHPQQMLYLPPFWFHHVESLQPSVSVNIWSNSREINQFTHLLNDPLPYLNEFERLELVNDYDSNLYCLEEFFKKLIHILYGDIQAYLSILKQSQLLYTHTVDDAPPVSCGKIEPAKKQQVDVLLTKYVQILYKTHFALMQRDISTIFLGSFLESLAAQFVSPVQVLQFLDLCLV